MVYIYPTNVRGTHYRSAQYHTQEMTNSNALCSSNQSLAGWGVKRPTWFPNYLRAWPDSLTSRSGSYYTPDPIHVSGFSLSGDGRAKITALSVEYKWEQVSYSCGTADCFGKFNNPIINLKYKNNVIGSTFGAKPEPNRYNNNKTDPRKTNTDTGELATLHSHSFNIGPYNLTAKDLKDIEVEFIPADNTSYNHLRIVMQFIRLSIEKEDYIPKPLCRVYDEIDKETALINEKFTYKVRLENVNKEFTTTQCNIDIPDGLSIVDYQCSDNNSFVISNEKNIWEIRQVNNDYSATLSIDLIGNKEGEKEITTKILNNADSLYHTTSKKINILKKNIAFNLKVNDNIFHEKYNPYITANILLTRSDISNVSESIIIESDGLFTSNENWEKLPGNANYIGNGKWEIYDIKATKLELNAHVEGVTAGDYTIRATHKEEGQNNIVKEEKISVLAEPLTKEYFKLRLEDGSDVRYNSLMFTEGDDLIYPLTYEVQDTTSILDYIKVVGEEKRIPTNEARYINFKLYLDTDDDITYKNILTTIDIDNGTNNDIVVGADEGIEIFNGLNNQYFIIDEIKSGETKNIRFIVQSNTERTCNFNLKILNEIRDDWTPSKIIFKDIPNIKLNIENITSSNDFFITEQNEGKFTLRYSIQNLSNIKGKKIKFKIKEPYDFKKGEVLEQPIEDSSFIYNENTKIWYFDEINDNKKHFIDIKYTAKKRNIYDFVLETYDNDEDMDDDQYINKFTYRMYINIDSNTKVTTSTSKTHPYINEIFDYKINVKNFTKKQDTFSFQIKDIGQYNLSHNQNHYFIENVDCEYGTFEKSKEKNNILGTWTLQDIDIDTEYELILSLRPISTGVHIINTVFTDSKQNTEDFNSYVKVYNEIKKIDFNVYQAIGEKEECQPCNELIEICDEDFVNIEDKYYYVFNIVNNNKNSLDKINVYAHIDESLQIDCEPQNVEFYKINDDIIELDKTKSEKRKVKSLYKFVISSMPKCDKITFCIRVTPTVNGEFLSDFVLTTKDSHILTKTLKMTVSNIFMERKLRHQIDIYNFEKTNRYFRYELDGSGNLFKFYNKGDLTYRFIRTENYDVNKVESYVGENLQDLYRQIKKKSIFVDPQWIREGNNKLMDNGYELYPDGFIRRFGLLKSEVFHFTGQLPRINNLTKYAMRWDIDDWNEKVWAGDIYSNGVFDLTIDYDKIPSNFDIMQDTMNPILNLQNIVDKNKPYGTKGICYYSYNDYLDLYIDAELNDACIETQYKEELELDKIGLISWYDRHDNSIFAHYDLFNIEEEVDTYIQHTDITNKDKNETSDAMEVNMYGYVDVYEPHTNKILTNECFNLIQMKYNYNTDKLRHNIDIIKTKYITKDIQLSNDANIFTLYNIINIIGTQTNEKEKEICNINDLHIVKINDKINNKNGFKVKEYKEMEIYFEEDINNYTIQIETYGDVHHLWVSINDKSFYHFGYIYGRITKFISNYQVYGNTEEPAKITIKVKDTINNINQDFDNIQQVSKLHKWDNLLLINKEKNSYTTFENNINIDKECKETHLDAPPLILKYSNIDIDDFDEITDIKLKIKAQSNKNNFMEDANIRFLKDAEYYFPDNNISRHIAYPNEIMNINKRYYPTLTIKEPNITICSKCLKTTLGYYDKCPHCNSKDVVHYKEKQKATYCHNCEWITDDWVERCEWCLSKKTEKIMIDYNRTVCNDCNHVANDYYLFCPHCFSENVNYVQNDTHTVDIYDNETQNIDPIIIQTKDIKNNICNIDVALNKDQVLAEELEYLTLHINGTNYDDGKYSYCPSCNNINIGNHTICPKCKSDLIENKINSNVIFNVYCKINNKIEKVSFKEGDRINYGDFNKTLDLKQLALKNQNNDYFTLIIYVENLMNEYQEYTNEELAYTITNQLYEDNTISDEEYYNMINEIIKKGIDNTDILLYTKIESSKDGNTIIPNKYEGRILFNDLYRIVNESYINNDFNEETFETDKITKENAPTLIQNLTEKNKIDILRATKTPQIYKEITSFNKSEKYQNSLTNTRKKAQQYALENYDIGRINISINNISSESKYKNEKEWEGNINTIYGKKHTSIKHKNNKNNTEYIQMGNFDFKQSYRLNKAYLCVDGINESKSHALMKINIINKNKTKSFEQYIENGIFSIKEDILNYTSDASIEDIKVQIGFETIDNSEMNILNTYIITEKERKNKIFNEINKIPINIYQEGDKYLVSSISNDIWGLNQTKPMYLSKKSLETGLLCYIDFGALNNDEYIRLYDVDLVITYKNQMGDIIIKNITYEDEKNINNIEGNVFRNHGKLIGNVKQKDVMLYNLEYNNITNTGNEDTFNAIPLRTTIKQSFICNKNNIAGFYVNYHGTRGYPNDFILAQLCEDNNNKPGNVLNECWIDMRQYARNSKIYIPLDKNHTIYDKKYWLILKDDTANEYNYHRFKYNNNNNIGKLIISDDKKEEMINYCLSFAVLNGYDVVVYNKIPIHWDSIINDKQQNLPDTEKYDCYNTLFRLNTNDNSNIRLNNLQIKKGYRIKY